MTSDPLSVTLNHASIREDLNRPLYLIYGLPFDAVGLHQAVDAIEQAVAARRRCFLSTPNLNFLVTSRSQRTMFDSVRDSDLSIPDGMPIVWMAKMLGIPIVERVGGSNLFEAMMKRHTAMRVFFFGGPPGVAEQACQELPKRSNKLECSGWLDPGMGDVEALSKPEYVQQIEQSQSDFLLIALGALKGQGWIMHNAEKLSTPVMVHLGAVINFVAGSVNRAPESYQKLGLEWLWRIKEEPNLWKRYWNDGRQFLSILFGNVRPYARWLKKHQPANPELQLALENQGGQRLYRLSGAACDGGLDKFIEALVVDLEAGADVLLDLDQLQYADPRFFALVLQAEKHCLRQQARFQIKAEQALAKKLLRWNGLQHLIP